MLDEGRTARINCRATPAELTALLEIAKVEERNVSDMMRKLIRDKARQLGLWPMDVKADDKKHTNGLP